MVALIPRGEGLERHLISSTLLLFVRQISLLLRPRPLPQRPLAQSKPALLRLPRGSKSGLRLAA